MDSIKSRAFSSTIWKFLERFSNQLMSMVIQIIIARILVPADYSVISIVTIFFAFANVFISGGFNVALIQKKNASEREYSAVLYTSLLVSAVLYIILYFVAPTIAALYEQPLLVPVIRVMALVLPVNAVKSIWCAYISSHLQFKKFFFSTLGGTICSGAVGIVMALSGFGAWALVAQQMSVSVIGTLILIFTTRIRLVLKISLRELKTLFRYGWKVFVSSIISTVYTELTPIIIGLKYSNEDLAFYTKGRGYPQLLTSSTTTTLSAVMFPVMAKYQDDKEKLLRYTRLFIRLSSYLAFPIMIGFLAVSENFVRVLLTDKWLPAVPYIKIFCIASMFDMIHIGNCETIKAMGKSGTYLIMEIIKKTAYFITIFAFLFFTDSPVYFALSAIACTLIAVVVNSIPNQKILGYTLGKQLADLIPNLLSASAMYLVVSFIGISLKNSLAPFPTLLIQILCGVLFYAFVSLVTKNPSFFYLLRTFKEMIFSKKKGSEK